MLRLMMMMLLLVLLLECHLVVQPQVLLYQLSVCSM
jgi:hypothetical protein